MPTVSFSQSMIAAMKNCVGVLSFSQSRIAAMKNCVGVLLSFSQSRIAAMKNCVVVLSFSQSRIAAMKNCVGVESRERGAGPVLPWRTLPPPPFPTPGQAWGTYEVCGCCRAGTTARANALTQIVPNLSSLYTLFYSVIYNSVTPPLCLAVKLRLWVQPVSDSTFLPTFG